MNYLRWFLIGVCGLVLSALVLEPLAVFGRGGGGGGRGGGVSRGGGGGGGGGGRVGGAPSFSRPSPSVSRPSTQPSRPSVGGGASVGSRPSIGSKSSTLPAVRPGGDRSAVGPGVAGKLPGAGDRPGVGTLPAQRPVTRPGIGTLPAAGIGAGTGLGAVAGNRLPGQGTRPATLPGLGAGGGGRWDQIKNDRPGWASDRKQDLQGRLDNRQGLANDWQNNRQDFLNDRHGDWQNWANDRHPWHDDWHHGCWNDHWGGYWEHMWTQHPVWSAFGVTGWGLNTIGYMFGTSGYSNPYYDSGSGGDVAYDYSQPIIPYAEPTAAAAPEGQAPAGVDTAAAALPPGVTQSALDQFEQARATFAQGDYKQALELTNQTLKSMPGDATVHEFRALCLFALGDYRQAAATLNPVLAVSPGWDWTTMASLYPDVDVYTAQLRKLEQYVKTHPDASDAQFVLAYHYLTTGSNDAAVRQLEKIVKTVPTDAVAKQMYEALSFKPSDTVAPQPVAEPAPSGPKLTADQLVGAWKAAGPGKAAFEMSLTKDGEFTWKYAQGKQQQVVQGVFAVDGNTLAMEPEAGGVMLAELTPQGQSVLNFKMIGTQDADPPLKFTRG